MIKYGKKEERKAIDLSHHLSELSKARPVSPLKGLARYLGKPGLVMLAGGMPSPEYFPFHELSAEVLVPNSFPIEAPALTSAPAETSWFWRLFGGNAQKEVQTTHISVAKYPADRLTVNLATALQYGTAQGLPALQAVWREFVGKVYKPAYDDWTVLADTGNTDGWSRCAVTLMNRGDGFLTEEWTYPSALAAARPFGIRSVPVAMDGNGMRPDALRKVLSEWNVEERGGMKRPHVMYTVPVGQNPSGANMPASRKKEIYDICVEYDVIICEDDPYYFQQVGEYIPKDRRSAPAASESVEDPARYIETLVPSYLQFDYQGRVIRMDTFSKTMAPGSRLGWFTTSPILAERLERQGETTTQSPCGFGQSLITQLLLSWKYDGYVRWLQGISGQYKMRRDLFIDALADEFDLQITPRLAVGVWEGCDVLVASEKIQGGEMSEKKVFGRKQFFSFVPPAAGMFVWLKLHFDGHRDLVAGKETEESLEMKLWEEIAEAGVLFSPGWFFSADHEHDDTNARGEGHFRIAFSSASADDMKKAARTFRRVLDRFFA